MKHTFSSAELLAAFLGAAGQRHRCQPLRSSFARSPLACRAGKQGNDFLRLATSPPADGMQVSSAPPGRFLPLHRGPGSRAELTSGSKHLAVGASRGIPVMLGA